MNEPDGAEGREPTRQVWHFGLLVAFVFALIASHLLARRPLMVASFNNVAPAGALPASVRADLAAWQLSDWSIVIHRSDWTPPVARLLGHTRAGPPRLGWVVHQWSVLTLPVVGWRQSDLAVVLEDDYGYRLSALTPEQRAAVDKAGAVGWFPWWRVGWGWLPIALFAGFAWGELRWQARRRALLGVM